jgi:hypothetical protein
LASGSGFAPKPDARIFIRPPVAIRRTSHGQASGCDPTIIGSCSIVSVVGWACDTGGLTYVVYTYTVHPHLAFIEQSRPRRQLDPAGKMSCWRSSRMSSSADIRMKNDPPSGMDAHRLQSCTRSTSVDPLSSLSHLPVGRAVDTGVVS